MLWKSNNLNVAQSYAGEGANTIRQNKGEKNKLKMFAQPWSGAAPAASAVSSANSNGIQAAD